MKKISKYCFFSYDGTCFSLSKKLIDEGKDVLTCQVVDASALGVESGLNDKEDKESRRRRLSLYDGILEKKSLGDTLSWLKKQKNKEEIFIFFDYNTFYKIAAKVLKMGYTNGLFPTEEDFELEKDRAAAKERVKEHYPELKLKETKEFSKVDEVIKFIEESDKTWVVKSDGNFAETLVPDSEDEEMAKTQVISQLNEHKKDFEKGGIVVEEKISNPFEFAPIAVFYNGAPLFTHVEIETRMLGCQDIGQQTGGNQNIVMRTKPTDLINKIAFPDIIYDIAKKHVGMYIADCGILSDGKDLFFTENAGNRFGVPCLFSEISACMEKGKIAPYFEALVNEEDPFCYNYGTALALYSFSIDNNNWEGIPENLKLYIKPEKEDDFFLYEIKADEKNEEEGCYLTVGYMSPLGWVTGRGNTMEEAIQLLYDNLKNFSLKGVYYRPQSDFMSSETNKCVMSRIKFIKEKNLIS